jgi:hypothetical protein
MMVARRTPGGRRTQTFTQLDVPLESVLAISEIAVKMRFRLYWLSWGALDSSS